MKEIFKNDTTLRLSFRENDILIWFRFNNIFTKESLNVLDTWKLKDGDYATLTNRMQDIPTWFELHPLEVKNRLVYRMMRKIEEEGYNPREIMDGPNIWRVKAGDTIVWLGKPRQGVKEEDGALSIIRFDEDALLLGESTSFRSIEETIGFGSTLEYSEDENKSIRNNKYSNCNSIKYFLCTIFHGRNIFNRKFH